MSPLYLFGFFIYLIVVIGAILLFDIRRSISEIETDNQLYFDRGIEDSRRDLKIRAFFLIPLLTVILISTLAVPLFFLFPRVGGAGYNSGLDGHSGFTGFSETVRLGTLGKIEQSNETVMRIRVDSGSFDTRKLKGVALDTFDRNIWRRSTFRVADPVSKNDKDLFVLDTAKGISDITIQTIYLEAIDSPIILECREFLRFKGILDSLTKTLIRMFRRFDSDKVG